jgi:DNA-binding LytR/AlgR family response regulator
LIKVAKLTDFALQTTGYMLVFYDITDVVSDAQSGVQRPETKRQFLKIPTVAANRIVLVDVPAVHYVRAEGHYTWIHTAQGSSFCNLNITDIESRLDENVFLRIHRSYIVNLSFVQQIVREDGKIMVNLRDGEDSLPVSRALAPLLLERLGIAETVKER